jgi:hypothetical protein
MSEPPLKQGGSSRARRVEREKKIDKKKEIVRREEMVVGDC